MRAHLRTSPGSFLAAAGRGWLRLYPAGVRSPLPSAGAGGRCLIAAALTVLALAVCARPAAAAPLDDRGYLTFADRVVRVFEPMWDEKARFYRAGPGGVEPMVNANLLLVH